MLAPPRWSPASASIKAGYGALAEGGDLGVVPGSFSSIGYSEALGRGRKAGEGGGVDERAGRQSLAGAAQGVSFGASRLGSFALDAEASASAAASRSIATAGEASHGRNSVSIRQSGSLKAALQYGETQLRALASQSDFYVDEDRLYEVLKNAHSYVADLEHAPPTDPRALDDAQRIAEAILRLCAAWLRLATSGGLDGAAAEGLRGPGASELVCTTIAMIVASQSGLAPALLLAFGELGGLALFGQAMCHMEEGSIVGAMRQLRTVAGRYRMQARGQGNGSTEALTDSIEAFRGSLFVRLSDLAGRQGRRLRVVHFKEVVAEMGGVLSGAFQNTQVFEMGCQLSLQLTVVLSAYCPGVPEADALEAIEWMALVLRNLLDQSAGPSSLGSPAAVRDWIHGSDLWSSLLWRSGCRTQHHTHHLLAVLLTRRAVAPCDLICSLGELGALFPSQVPAPSRLAVQGALLAATANIGVEAILDLFGELSGALGLQNMSEEGIDLLVRLTQRAVSAGYDPVGASHESMSLGRSLAVAHLLRYLQWCYGQMQPPHELLEFARRALLRTLAPHPAFSPLLAAIAAEALCLAAAPPAGLPFDGMARYVRAMCSLAIEAASAGAACEAGRPITSIVAHLCGALPTVAAEVPFGAAEAQIWVAAFTDTLACYLRLPGAQIAAPQVGTLWSRLIVRPVFGVSMSTAAMQYFKLALLAQPAAGSALVAPLLAAPNPPAEVRLAHASIFCPVSFDDDPPPIPGAFFFPDVAGTQDGRSAADRDVLPPLPQADSMLSIPIGDIMSPPRLPHALRHSPDSIDFSEVDMLSDGGGADEASLAATAVNAGLTLPDTSACTPRLRLDRVQAVMHQGSATLLGELTVYDAIERRLWDEFNEHGTVEDTDALRQRDQAAIRCLAALDREIDGAGVAGRELPAPLTEARAKFSRLCEQIVSGFAQQVAKRLHDAEMLFAKAEDELVGVRAAHQRLVSRCRRQGEQVPTSSPEVTAARAALARANVLLVAELRVLAMRAALGLVEVVGCDGLSRALRVAGKGHADPLLERLHRHARWSMAQAERQIDLPIAAPADSEQPSAQPSKPRSESSTPIRSEGLAGYDDIRELPARSRHVRAGRRGGARVALKQHTDGKSAPCMREILALEALRSECIVSLQGIFQCGGATYLELAWYPGGTLEGWCRQNAGMVNSVDAECFVRGLGMFRQVWNAVAFLHMHGAVHGDLALSNVLLTADHRPVLADFKRCVLDASSRNAEDWKGAPRPTVDYVAPELQGLGGAETEPLPTQASDVYSAGVMMAKAFLGLNLEVSACPYDQNRGQRRLPDEKVDVDLLDLVQALLATEPASRPSALSAVAHRSFEPSQFLRRQGLLGHSTTAGKTPQEAVLNTAERLRDEYRGHRVSETMMFSREAVFETIVDSSIGEWGVDALLGEWRVMLNDESGIDGGGLRRELVTLFFEQLEQSNIVFSVGSSDIPGTTSTMFVNDRQLAGKSPQQWRKIWTVVGAMILRAVVHFGNAPVALSSVVFDCAFGRFEKMPPDLDGEDALDGGCAELAQMRQQRGDEWGRSELLEILRRLKQADQHKESGYRWMLTQRTMCQAPDSGRQESASVYAIAPDILETFSHMLDDLSRRFLIQNSEAGRDGSISHAGGVLEWTLLWDIYLKFFGGGDRWLAYQSLLEGLTARGSRHDLWSTLTGEGLTEILEGAPLTADAIIENLEFKPNYGIDLQVQYFTRVIQSFSSEELAMFLRFATGIGNLPANRRFPAGQKLQIRFLPEDEDRLPASHTCFWVIDVPKYTQESDMGSKLRMAIAALQPFTFS